MKKKLSKNKILKTIDQIEKVRSKNNINWMDIIRLAVNHAPNETLKVIKKLIVKIKKYQNYLKDFLIICNQNKMLQKFKQDPKHYQSSLILKIIIILSFKEL